MTRCTFHFWYLLYDASKMFLTKLISYHKKFQTHDTCQLVHYFPSLSPYLLWWPFFVAVSLPPYSSPEVGGDTASQHQSGEAQNEHSQNQDQTRYLHHCCYCSLMIGPSLCFFSGIRNQNVTMRDDNKILLLL